MKTIAEIRLHNLELLIQEFGTQDKVAEAGETSSVYLSQIKNQTPDNKTGKLRQMGDDMARKLEIGCKKERGWMDNLHTSAEPGVTYLRRVDMEYQPAIASEAPPPPMRYDIWTTAAIDMLQRLDAGQRQAMVARMREYTQFLDPPRVGQAL